METTLGERPEIRAGNALGSWLALISMVVGLVVFSSIFGVSLGFCFGSAIYGFIKIVRWMVSAIVIPLTHGRIRLGRRCPSCEMALMNNVACISLGYRYFECPECRCRVKRKNVLEPWQDSKDSEDAGFYGSKSNLIVRRAEGKLLADLILFLLFFAVAAIALGVGFWIGSEKLVLRCMIVVCCVSYVVYRTIGSRKPAAQNEVLWDRDLDHLPA